MQEDLFSFARRKNFEESQKSQKENIEETKNEGFSQTQINDAKQLFEKYKDFSENDLTGEIAKIIYSQKQNGTFNKEKIYSMLNSISQFIPQDKANQLKELIEQIDTQN